LQGYLAAVSASSYSFVSMMQRFAPIMNEGGAAISLTYLASERIIPGYGGGMSSAKAVGAAARGLLQPRPCCSPGAAALSRRGGSARQARSPAAWPAAG
jgi:hypothetical protein